MDDDYELLPHEELENIRKELSHLRKNPYSDSKQNKNLLDSMDDLNTSIKKLIKIFEGAQDEIIKEYSEASPTKLLKEISDQNAKIAEGIIALASMVKSAPKAAPVGSMPPSTMNPSMPPINPNPRQNTSYPQQSMPRNMPLPPSMMDEPKFDDLGPMPDLPPMTRKKRRKPLFAFKK